MFKSFSILNIQIIHNLKYRKYQIILNSKYSPENEKSKASHHSAWLGNLFKYYNTLNVFFKKIIKI